MPPPLSRRQYRPAFLRFLTRHRFIPSQQPAGTVQLRFRGAGGDPRHLRDLMVLVALHVVQHEHGARSRRQHGQSPLEVHALVGPARRSGAVEGVEVVRGHHPRVAPPARPALAQGRVHGQCVEPRPNALSRGRSPACAGPVKRLLRELLGLRGVAAQPQQSANTRPRAGDRRSKAASRTAVAAKPGGRTRRSSWMAGWVLPWACRLQPAHRAQVTEMPVAGPGFEGQGRRRPLQTAWRSGLPEGGRCAERGGRWCWPWRPGAMGCARSQKPAPRTVQSLKERLESPTRPRCPPTSRRAPVEDARRFYQRHGYEPAWMAGRRPRREAAGLMAAVEAARADGLDPPSTTCRNRRAAHGEVANPSSATRSSLRGSGGRPAPYLVSWPWAGPAVGRAIRGGRPHWFGRSVRWTWPASSTEPSIPAAVKETLAENAPRHAQYTALKSGAPEVPWRSPPRVAGDGGVHRGRPRKPDHGNRQPVHSENGSRPPATSPGPRVWPKGSSGSSAVTGCRIRASSTRPPWPR